MLKQSILANRCVLLPLSFRHGKPDTSSSCRIHLTRPRPWSEDPLEHIQILREKLETDAGPAEEEYENLKEVMYA